MFFHATNPLTLFEEEVDQIATVGFEMFIYSFGSGFNVRVVPELRIQELPAAFTLPPDNSAQLEANSSAYTDLIKCECDVRSFCGFTYNPASPFMHTSPSGIRAQQGLRGRRL